MPFNGAMSNDPDGRDLVPDIPTSQLTRRDLMGAAAGLVVTGCAGSAQKWDPKPVVANDDIVDLDIANHPELSTAGGMLALDVAGRRHPILVMRLEHDTFRAMSLRCPHLGCTVRWDNDVQLLVCPCHKSKFDDVGTLRDGPAKTGLEQFQTQFLGMAGNEGGTRLRVHLPKPS